MTTPTLIGKCRQCGKVILDSETHQVHRVWLYDGLVGDELLCERHKVASILRGPNGELKFYGLVEPQGEVSTS
jgi:hypothetical protein